MDKTISSTSVKNVFKDFIYEFTKDTGGHEIITSVDLSESVFVNGEPCFTLMTSGHYISKAKVITNPDNTFEFSSVDLRNVFHTWNVTTDLSRSLNYTPELNIDFSIIRDLVQKILNFVCTYKELIDCLEFISLDMIRYNDFRNYKISGNIPKGTSIVDVVYNMNNLKPSQCLNSLALRDDYKPYSICQKYGKRRYASGAVKDMLLIKY